jgi:hypothetical protein
MSAETSRHLDAINGAIGGRDVVFYVHLAIVIEEPLDQRQLRECFQARIIRSSIPE